MPALDAFLNQSLAALEKAHLTRKLHEDQYVDAINVLRSGRKYISFASNDYLGLSHHPQVVAAGVEALERYGTGGGASRLVTGNHPLYAETEVLLATMKGTEAALIFGCGYLTHIGVIPALVGKGDLIVLDEFSHASIIDAAKLSGAAMMRFHHNDMQDAEKQLVTFRGKYERCLLATETTFSMDGDTAPVGELAALARKYDAWLLTDDAHGMFQNTKYAAIQMGTLSKAAGNYGGYVCGSRALISYLMSKARSFIFSTSLPPATLASIKAALEVIQSDPDLAKRPLKHAELFSQLLGLPPVQSPIVPLIIGENEPTLKAAEKLQADGFLVPAIRPPTVPRGTARLRFSFSAAHQKEDIQRLAECVRKCHA
ncbi:MAG: 8-amino-7-oxononanoate synthase [Rickettsiales bacterium]